jgi:hypothetical protein
MKNMKPFRNLLPALFTAFLLTLIQGWGNTAQAQTTYPVVFRVDMSDYNGSTPINGVFLNGTFNAWCGSCAPMTDANNDSVWELTVPLAADTFEYKFTINGWTAQETLIPGSSCTNTAFGFTNRQIIVGGPLSLPAPCYGSCDSCTGAPSSGRIRFRVDMNGYAGPTFTNVNLNGAFNGWCGACATMLDPDQDSIYELDLDLPLSTVEYKFTLDGWGQQENLLSGSPCTMTTGQFTNRVHTVTGNDTLDAVCWESCSPCFPVGIRQLASDNKLLKVYPNPVQDVLHLELPLGETLQDPTVLRWSDIQGRDVQGFVTSSGQGNRFNVEALSPGLYTVQFRTARAHRVVRFLKN